MNKQISITVLWLIISMMLFSLTNIDFIVQDAFYNQQSQSWILNRDLEPYKFIFYDGIKKLLILVACSFLIFLIFLKKNHTLQVYRKGVIVVILSAILVPLSVGGLKKVTNMPCPKNEVHYGGVYPSTKVWKPYPKAFNQSPIQCFPAGHASGGFALLSLFFLFKSKRNKTIAIMGALVVGWSMGFYKMLIGDHFLSHTFITMILAWLIVLMIAKNIFSSLSKKPKY